MIPIPMSKYCFQDSVRWYLWKCLLEGVQGAESQVQWTLGTERAKFES